MLNKIKKGGGRGGERTRMKEVFELDFFLVQGEVFGTHMKAVSRLGGPATQREEGHPCLLPPFLCDSDLSGHRRIQMCWSRGEGLQKCLT